MQRLNLFVSEANKDNANAILTELIGGGAEDTFGVPRILDSKTVYVASWYATDEQAETIRTIYPDLIKETEDFTDFGCVEE